MKGWMSQRSDIWVNKNGHVQSLKNWYKRSIVVCPFAHVSSSWLGSTLAWQAVAIPSLSSSFKHALQVCFMTTATWESKQCRKTNALFLSMAFTQSDMGQVSYGRILADMNDGWCVGFQSSYIEESLPNQYITIFYKWNEKFQLIDTQSPTAKSKHSSKQNVNTHYLLKMRLCPRITLGISQNWIVGKVLSEIFPYKIFHFFSMHLNPILFRYLTFDGFKKDQMAWNNNFLQIPNRPSSGHWAGSWAGFCKFLSMLCFIPSILYSPISAKTAKKNNPSTTGCKLTFKCTNSDQKVKQRHFFGG